MHAAEYKEDTREAKRQWELLESTLRVSGTLHGLSYVREFDLKSLSSRSRNVVQIRYDIVRRCIFLMLISAGIGLVVGELKFSYSSYVSWIFFGLALFLLKSTYDWISKKEEAETFVTMSGALAFEIYNDSPGSAGFARFIRYLKTRIDVQPKSKPNTPVLDS